MGDKVGDNPVALRAAVFLLSAKNRRGGVQTPPAGRRLSGIFITEVWESNMLLFIYNGRKHDAHDIEHQYNYKW